MNETVENELTNLVKELEKALIRNTLAPASVQTSENQKRHVETISTAKLTRIKSTNASFQKNFQAAAKGTWVSQVIKAFKATDQKLEQL